MPEDALLQAYRTAQDEGGATRHLDCLLREHALPIVTAILESRLHVSLRHRTGRTQSQAEQDAEDLCARIVLDLTEHLRESRSDPASAPFQDFRAYVAVTAYRAFGRYLADRYRSRAALREQIEYLLTRREGFALWTGEARRRLCGLAGWRDRHGLAAAGDRLRTLRTDPHDFTSAALGQDDPETISLTALLLKLFGWLGGPVELDDLLQAVALLRGVDERRPVSLSDEAVQGKVDLVRSVEPPVGVQVERREYVRRLWAEIRQLPARECSALLLDMTRADGLAVIVQFPLHGVATVADIAGAVGMGREAFAALWGELPLPDEAVASILLATPQQVVNLRQSARRRLAKRLYSAEEW